MTAAHLLMILVGAAAGGFVNGLAGFGTALFALGFWLQVTEPPVAVAMSATISVLIGLQGLWEIREDLHPQARRTAGMLLPALIGIPIGTSLLALLSPVQLRLTIAGFLLLYGLFFGLRRQLPKLGGDRPITDGIIGLAGGILGGAASLSGLLPTMWCALRGWPKSQTRAVLQPFNVAVLALTIMVLLLRGDSFGRETLINLAVAIPAALVAGRLGLMVFRRLNDDQFRRILILMMLIIGFLLILRDLGAILGSAT